MWLFLSRRIRTWLLFAVAVPAARSGVHYAARRAAAADATSNTSRVLRRADVAITKVSRRRGK